jgi:DNA-binding protein HU-beta
MESIKTSMTNGDNVYLRGFGTFLLKNRKEKTGRNITRNTSVTIPAHVVPAFKPSKEFTAEIKAKVRI